jgi:tetratricopeptide (TPR) repeat protein
VGNRQQAVNFYNQAVQAIGDKSNTTNSTTAWQLWASACFADPTWFQAYLTFGNNAFDLDKRAAAIAAYRRCLACEIPPLDRAKALCNLGWALHADGQTQKAYTALQESIALDSTSAAAHINLANVHGIMDQPALALKAAKRGYELDPNDPTNEVVYAFALLFNRNLAEGFKHFESRFKWKLHAFLQYPYPKWRGEEGKTVFLVADQGLGDTISFSRFVRAAAKRAKFIHCYVQPELMRLFMHAFVDLPNLNLLPFGSTFPDADAWTTFVSLPFALGLTDDEIRNAPDIEYPRLQLPTSWLVPDQKLHVGIAWAGSNLNNINSHRSIPAEMFAELYRVPGVQLYSLQVGEHREDANAAGMSGLVRNLVPYIADVVDTLTLMRELDLIITCESALGHIAALAGKECWIPYSYLGRDYRLAHTGKDRLWTPHHKVFRQGQDMRWQPVFDKIVGALREKIHESRRAA